VHHQVELDAEEFQAMGTIPLDEVAHMLSGLHDRPAATFADPIINVFELEVLSRLIKIFSDCGLPLVRKWYWPNDRAMCLLLTHDVDGLFPSPTLHRSPVRSLLDLIRFVVDFATDNPSASRIPELCSKEKDLGVVSSFFFLHPQSYGSKAKTLSKIVNALNPAFEIGLHATPRAAENAVALMREKVELERVTHRAIHSARFHFLVCYAPFTYRSIERTGFSSDCTSCYRDLPGFRDGTCLPFHPIDLFAERKMSLLEIPTCFMDTHLVDQPEQPLPAKQVILKLFDIASRFNGCLMFNFHNEFQDRARYPRYVRTYEDLLSLFANRNDVWNATVSQVTEWWLTREKTNPRLFYDPKADRIHGSCPDQLSLRVERPGNEQSLVGRFQLTQESSA
jgi:hypothetical protein